MGVLLIIIGTVAFIISFKTKPMLAVELKTFKRVKWFWRIFGAFFIFIGIAVFTYNPPPPDPVYDAVMLVEQKLSTSMDWNCKYNKYEARHFLLCTFTSLWEVEVASDYSTKIFWVNGKARGFAEKAGIPQSRRVNISKVLNSFK